jgi:hypothetical protein
VLWAIGIFLTTFVLSLLIFVVIIVALPPRYFASDQRQLAADQSPVVRSLIIVGKNLLGLAVIGVGILLSLPGIPGQGIFTIVVGLMLLDIPGKHRLARRVVRQRRVLRTINRLRSWFGRPPLVVDGS